MTVSLILLWSALFVNTECWRECGDDEPKPELSAELERTFHAVRGKVVMLTVSSWVTEGDGTRSYRSEDFAGLLMDPQRGDVITDPAVLHEGSRVAARFVGLEDTAPRRAEVLGADEVSGLAVVRLGAVSIEALPMPVSLVSLQDVARQDTVVVSFQRELPGERARPDPRFAAWATKSTLDCGGVFPWGSPQLRTVGLSFAIDPRMGQGGLVASADGRPLGWIQASSATSPAAGSGRAVGGRDGHEADGVEPARIEARALPMLAVARALERVLCTHAVRPEEAPEGPGRPWMGIGCETLSDPTLRHHLGLAAGAILVQEVYHDSPASRAGLERHHILVSCNGVALSRSWHLGRALQNVEVGDVLKLGVIQAGKLEQIELEVGVW